MAWRGVAWRGVTWHGVGCCEVRYHGVAWCVVAWRGVPYNFPELVGKRRIHRYFRLSKKTPRDFSIVSYTDIKICVLILLCVIIRSMKSLLYCTENLFQFYLLNNCVENFTL